MGRVARGRPAAGRLLAAALLALGSSAVAPPSALGFDGFGALEADATFDGTISFEVELPSGAPDRLELLLHFADDEVTFVAPVVPSGGRGRYTWEAGEDYVHPNTPIHYRWRAVDGGEAILSAEATLLYDDDRPGLDWRVIDAGEARVHWYGDTESAALRFAELSAGAVERTEALFGSELAGPVDLFVYDSDEDFFGALGPGTSEWVGAQALAPIRTIYIWLGAGDATYLDRVIVHEIAHIVFDDATDNPYHEPARWLDEGLAVWSESEEVASERGVVELEAGARELLAFEAIAEQFPPGERDARLAYAQGAVFVDDLIGAHGREAIAGIAAAYRDGATDAEAVEAGTGIPLAELEAGFYAGFGVDPPRPIEPEPLLPAVVRELAETPDAGGPVGSSRPDERPAPATEAPPGPLTERVPWLAPTLFAALSGLFLVAAARFRARRG